MDDPLRQPILRALLELEEEHAPVDYAPTTREVVDYTRPPDTPGVTIVLNEPLVQESLRRLEREELVDQVVEAAQYHAHGEPTPIGTRRWRLTQAGRTLATG